MVLTVQNLVKTECDCQKMLFAHMFNFQVGGVGVENLGLHKVYHWELKVNVRF